jgi:hypothetical protein
MSRKSLAVAVAAAVALSALLAASAAFARDGRLSTSAGPSASVAAARAPASAPKPTPKPTPAPKQTPIALGAYLGAGPGSPVSSAAIAAYKALVGRAPAIVMWYAGWGNPYSAEFDEAALNRVAAVGATPMISWDPSAPDGGLVQPAYAPARIAAGDWDAYLHRYAKAAAVWGRPIYLNPMHEANGNWSPWSIGVGGTTGADFIAAYRHIVSVFRSEHASNVRFVWAVNVAYPGSTPYAAFYPGDAWVDYLGLDGYNWGTTPDHTWQTPAQVFSASYAVLTALSVRPVLITETSSAETGGNKATWITQLGATVPTLFPRVRGLVWFDEDKETDWRLNSSPASLVAFRALAALPAWSGRLTIGMEAGHVQRPVRHTAQAKTSARRDPPISARSH